MTMMNISDALNVIKAHQAKITVQVIDLANELGLKVYEVPNWPDDLSGMVRKNVEATGGFDIFVNQTHAETRRRFTIAHEIAHVVLHPHLIGDGITDDALLRSGLSNDVEAQANRLAADILMPREALNSRLKMGINSVYVLATEFKVSDQAMAIRLGVAQ
jgi:Zn-dependent peptidase ImmA (M78 family)